MKKSSVPGRNNLIYLLLVVASTFFIAATMIIYNNSFRSLPLFFFLFIVGICLMLAFGLIRGGAGGLIVISAWVGLKRFIGVWQEDFLWTNIIELGTLLGAFAICGIYGERLRVLLEAYFTGAARLELLNLDDSRTGLIKAAIGKLRLQEEEERSVRYRRPFSLLLIQVQSKTESDLDPYAEGMIMRVVANTVKSTTRRTDIPFQVASDQIALILPETNQQGANRVVHNVISCMLEARILLNNNNETSLQDLIAIRYGFATFTGNSRAKIDMLKAAEHSLEQVLSKVPNQDFQETPLEWVVIGESLPVGMPGIPTTSDNRPIAVQEILTPPNPGSFEKLSGSESTIRKVPVSQMERSDDAEDPPENIGTK